MSETEARVYYSASEGKLELQGSEKFVAEQFSKFAEVILKSLESTKSIQVSVSNPNSSTSASIPIKNSNGEEGAFIEFENLYVLADDKIQILKDLPGANKSEKTVNAGLLACHAKFLLGVTPISTKIIRDICTIHACLDSSNFAQTLKAQKEYFILTGSSSNKMIALSKPGLKKAEEIARSLNS